MSSEMNSLNKISSVVHEKNQVVWENEAYAKCYKEKSAGIYSEINKITEEIINIDKEIEEIKPKITQLNFCFEVQVETLQINHRALINQRLYKRTEEESLKKLKEKQAHVLDEYTKNYNRKKNNLEKSSGFYRQLQSMQLNLRKTQIQCLRYKQKIITLKKINAQKFYITQKLFYNDIVLFAKAWLKQRKISVCSSTIQKAKLVERESLKKLLEVQELVKKQQRVDRSGKDDRTSLITRFELAEKNNKQLKRPAEGEVFSNTKFDKLFNDSQKNVTKYFLPKTTLNKFNSDKSKVRILDVRTIKPAFNMEKHMPLKSPIKRKNSMSVSAKLDQVVTNLSQKMSSQQSTFKSLSQKNSSTTPQNSQSMKYQPEVDAANKLVEKEKPREITQMVENIAPKVFENQEKQSEGCRKQLNNQGGSETPIILETAQYSKDVQKTVNRSAVGPKDLPTGFKVPNISQEMSKSISAKYVPKNYQKMPKTKFFERPYDNKTPLKEKLSKPEAKLTDFKPFEKINQQVGVKGLLENEKMKSDKLIQITSPFFNQTAGEASQIEHSEAPEEFSQSTEQAASGETNANNFQGPFSPMNYGIMGNLSPNYSTDFGGNVYDMTFDNQEYNLSINHATQESTTGPLFGNTSEKPTTRNNPFSFGHSNSGFTLF